MAGGLGGAPSGALELEKDEAPTGSALELEGRRCGEGVGVEAAGQPGNGLRSRPNPH